MDSNKKFAVVRTAFHGGGVVGYYETLGAARAAARKARTPWCQCGCNGIVPITNKAASEMWDAGYEPLYLLDEIPSYTTDMPCSKLAK